MKGDMQTHFCVDVINRVQHKVRRAPQQLLLSFRGVHCHVGLHLSYPQMRQMLLGSAERRLTSKD